VRNLILLAALCALGFGCINAAIALGDNPHPPGCKGDPHNCQPSTSTAPSTATVTVAAPAAAPPQVQTVTVNAPTTSSTSSAAGGSATVTIIVPASTVRTIVRVKVKKLRRYCTMQRHGWRCTGHPPRSKAK
jgi:hypothetical protein